MNSIQIECCTFITSVRRDHKLVTLLEIPCHGSYNIFIIMFLHWPSECFKNRPTMNIIIAPHNSCADPGIFVGWVGVKAQVTKKLWSRFFSPQFILQRGSNGHFKENYIFAKIPGSKIFCRSGGGGGGCGPSFPVTCLEEGHKTWLGKLSILQHQMIL